MKINFITEKILAKNYWNIIVFLTRISIKLQKRNTFLGSFWMLIQPFLNIITISYFFGFLLKQNTKVMALNLVGGMPMWGFINSCTSINSNSILSRVNIMKSTIITKTYFPIADCLGCVYNFFITFTAMYVGVCISYPEYFDYKIILAPILVLPLIVSMMSFGIMLAFITPYIRDISRAIEVILSIIYWTIPIMYPYSLIPESKRIFFEWHPIYLLIRPLQSLIITKQVPNVEIILKAWCVAMLVSVFSLFMYRKYAKRAIYYL